jgi:uncharacterized protein (TIGR01777 family)
MATILITGGSGLIGTALTKALLQQGHAVRHLGRGAGRRDGVSHFRWDPVRGTIDPRAVDGVDHIVHLAGAGIADKRWTKARVQELVDSRATTARSLLKAVQEHGATPAVMVSAAGISYYGAITTDHVFTENDAAGDDTIARISVAWEQAVDEWRDRCRVVKLRTPIVLARSGPLQRMVAPVRLGLGAPLGNGRQWMPWVHIDDLVAIYVKALFDPEMHGAYNVNTGNDVTNGEMMRTAARVLRRPFFLPKVSGFVLRTAFGDLAAILLEGSRASNKRLLATGFRFAHPELKGALEDLLR